MKTSPRVKTETLRKKKKDEPNTNVIYVDKIVKVQSKKPIKIMNSPKYEES